MSDVAALKCARCGAPVNPQAAGNWLTVLSCACCNRSAPREERAYNHRDQVFCTEACSARTTFRTVAAVTEKCAQCGGPLKDGSHDVPMRRVRGRPGSYCSPGCARAREVQLSRALKALARNTVPSGVDKLRQALADAETLARHWGVTKVAALDSTPGRRPHPGPVEPPADRAKLGLKNYLGELRRAVAEAEAAETRRVAEEAEAQRRKGWRARLERQQKADKRWREELTQGPL